MNSKLPEEIDSWLEVSLIVFGELAEAVAEVLRRFAPNGVAIESTYISPDPEGEGAPRGPLRVCAYLPVDDDLEEKRRKLEEALWYLGRIQPIPEPSYRVLPETDWAEAWKRHFSPINVGRRLSILPAWMEPPDQGRLSVRIDPGMAFGTGTHPSTQLCLEMIEGWFVQEEEKGRKEEGVSVIDLGCGSGILAVAALKLGAGRALGVDVDPQAIRSARQNAENNGVEENLELEVGSLADILAGKYSLRQAPLVVANILAPTLIKLLEEGLAEIVAPGGALILSGILAEQATEVIAVAEKSDLRVVETRQQEDWVALALERSSE